MNTSINWIEMNLMLIYFFNFLWQHIGGWVLLPIFLHVFWIYIFFPIVQQYDLFINKKTQDMNKEYIAAETRPEVIKLLSCSA